MTTIATPPFRADHVGSLLRPQAVKDARRRFYEDKAIDAEELAEIENAAIDDAIRMHHLEAAVIHPGLAGHISDFTRGKHFFRAVFGEVEINDLQRAGIVARIDAIRRAPAARGSGDWISALALFAYAALFSLAYVQLEAGAGALLRAARERQGLHLAALAAQLKVAPRKLEALEADRYDELPDATFVRALAASMCRVLKIDPAPVLERLPQARGAGLALELEGDVLGDVADPCAVVEPIGEAAGPAAAFVVASFFDEVDASAASPDGGFSLSE